MPVNSVGAVLQSQHLTLRSSGRPKGRRLPQTLGSKDQMRQALGVLSRRERLRCGRWPSSTPWPVQSAGMLASEQFALAATSFHSRRHSFSLWQLRCEPRHSTPRCAQNVRQGSSHRCSGLPVLRRSAHGSFWVTAARMQTRACVSLCQGRALGAMQFVSSLSVGSASRQGTLAHLRSQCEPNPSFKRTAPGVPWAAA
jgi:hypothetical protein